MATLKLKKPGTPGQPASRSDRAPVRGAGSGVRKPRPTLAQAEVERAEREARYQEQLRQRFGDRPPARFTRLEENEGRGGRPGGPGAPARREGPPGAPRNAPPRERGAFGDDRRDTRNARPERDAFGERPRAGARDDRDPRRDPRAAPGRADDRRPPARGDQRYGGPRDDGRGQVPRVDDRAARHRPDPGAPGRGNTAFGRDEAPPTAFGRPGPNSGGGRPAPRDPQRARPPERPEAPARRGEAPGAEVDAAGTMRLSKRMSELGIASRREADEWIPKGWVRVDGRVVTELGSRVTPGQHITIDAKARNQQSARVTVLINKPVGYVSGQAEDGYEPAYVLVTPDNQWREDASGIRFQMSHLRNLAPAGRLDIDSVGLLVLTQDGRIAKQLIGEDSEVEKEYLVRVRTTSGDALPQASLALLRHGLSLDGVQLQPAVVEWINDDQLRFVLREGRKRQIRRMCEAVGLEVLGLKRVRIGTVMLGDLPPGQWRYLRYDERFAALQATAVPAGGDGVPAEEDLADDELQSAADDLGVDDGPDDGLDPGDLDAQADAAAEAHGDEGDGRDQ